MTDYIFNFRPELDIHYRYKPASADNQHLLIVMSGFNLPDPTIYDFTLLQHTQSAVLWIKDDFNGLPAYYLCNNMNFEIEHGVSQLIRSVIELTTPSNVSILGASKGGSAALYFGVRHNIKNIITAVPQFYLGDYAATMWPKVGDAMMGSTTPAAISLLNKLLPNAIRRDRQTDKNIYLFTALADYQREQEILPHLELLEKYQNFNLIESASPCITQHNEVTRYNLNLILALIYQLEQEIIPRWGHICNGSSWDTVQK
ncbi:hypothetical protein [Pantoea endophytica]|uniref:hypothetical protein n=1 Tax=Pantoea endophytica TaxID=92488 RepID=UPI002412E8A3|nr:hypothetical protein [Pantoea endophytica]